MKIAQELTDAEKFATYCQGKIKFDNQAAANKVANKSRERHESKLSPYKCPCCSGFHIGMTMRKKGRMRKVRHHKMYGV